MLRSAVALAVIAAALVAACGSDSNAEQTSTSTNATASTNDDTGSASPAQGTAAAGRGVRLVKVGDFQSPLYVTAPPGDRRRIFVVEQAGRIVVVRGGRTLAKPFLDIRSKVTAGGEQGLLSMAFAPDYAQSGLFYVYYTEKSGTESIWEYHRAGDDKAAYELGDQALAGAAAQSGVIDRAKGNTTSMLTAMLKQLGYTNVTVTFVESRVGWMRSCTRCVSAYGLRVRFTTRG